jgi:hypothetical protein
MGEPLAIFPHSVPELRTGGEPNRSAEHGIAGHDGGKCVGQINRGPDLRVARSRLEIGDIAYIN